MATQNQLHERFDTAWPQRWSRQRCGQAILTQSDTGLRLINAPTIGATYTNAQIDDTQGLPRRCFRWRPPLSLTVRARFSHNADQLRGTAGFGFWNDPFAMSGGRRFTLPRAIWFFFASPPSNMALAAEVQGWGWKAATIDAWRWPFFALLPTAPLAVFLTRSPLLYRRLWPNGQAAIGVSEAPVAASMTEWRAYRIVWDKHWATFHVDDQLVLETTRSPGGPLGLVIWMDNQYMVVTPQGRFAHGLVAQTEMQWLELGEITLR